MAATLSQQRHRNVIVIPIDVYRKYTESSSSDSSSMPARWPTSCGRSSRDRSKADIMASHMATYPTSYRTQGHGHPQTGGKLRPKPRPKANPSKNKSMSTLQLVQLQNAADTAPPSVPTASLRLPYQAPSYFDHQDNRLSIPMKASSPSIAKPSAADLLPIEQWNTQAACNPAVTIGGTIATIKLQALSSSLSSKRELSTVSDRCTKRIKLKLDTHRPATTHKQQQKEHQPVIVISDSDDNDEAAPTSSNATGVNGVPQPPPILAPSKSTATIAQAHQRYRLSKPLRRLVDTIFPSHEQGNQATLERALATCPQLSNDYLIDRFLGSGSSGFVLSAKRVSDGKEVAIKVIPHAGEQTENKVRRELDILVSIKSHENILDFVEYFTSSLENQDDLQGHSPSSQPKTDIYYIVTEMGGSSLFDFIEMHRPEASSSSNAPTDSTFASAIHEGVLRSVFTQLSLALHSLHSQSVVHGDIKDENALINVDPATNTYRAKLCDFGHSKHLKPGSGPSFTFYGTTILAPPEMDSNIILRAKKSRQLQQQSNGRKGAAPSSSGQVDCWKRFLGYEADVWAMGLMLYTMIHGDLPAELLEKDPKLLAAYKRRRRSNTKKLIFEHVQAGLDPELKDLLEKMLAVDPDRRITMSEVINHPWMLKG
ncbi:serine/threonine-protein kinase KIN2, partial [Podila epigama]